MAFVQYDVTDTANDKLDETELYDEIIAASTWLQSCEGISRRGGAFRAFFPNDLPPAERTILDGVVAAHTGNEPPAARFVRGFRAQPSTGAPGNDATKAVRVVDKNGITIGFIPIYDNLW